MRNPVKHSSDKFCFTASAALISFHHKDGSQSAEKCHVKKPADRNQEQKNNE